jgi:regulator of protease activity HflC (stomatin/prohibitin superfamily)
LAQVIKHGKRKMLNIFTIKKNQIGLLKKNGEIKNVLQAGVHRFLDPLKTLTVEIFDHSQPEIKGESADYLRDYFPELVEKHCVNLTLSQDEIGLRYDHDTLVEIIANNRQYLYWKNVLNQRIEKVNIEQGYVLPEMVAEAMIKAKGSKGTIVGAENVLFRQISAYCLGVVRVNGAIVDVLAAGNYCYWLTFKHVEIDNYALNNAPLENSLSQRLLNHHSDLLERHCINMTLTENEIGLRYENDALAEILAPGTSNLYWRGAVEQRLVKLPLKDNLRVEQEIVNQLIQPKLRKHIVAGANGVLLAQVPTYHIGILKVDGKIERLLEAGISGYWSFSRDVGIEVVDTRIQSMEVSGQEILTRDKVNLRINLIANWRYSDILLAHSTLAKPGEHIYRELQFGLREAVGTRTLDELLENKQVIDEVVSHYIAEKLQGYGIEIATLGVKDIVLPGDMKAILSQVVEAEKSAQANVIRRREETAATRSLLNTAKVMENNPVALRLKEMETLERVAERIDKISVYGGLDQVLNGLVNIKAH